MKVKCIVSSCRNAGSKCCGACGLVQYCSIECQKEDWKKHHKKRECVNMKKLSSVTLTEREVNEVADKVSCMSARLSAAGEDGKCIVLLKECIDFTRDRLGRLDRNSSRSLIGDGWQLNSFVLCRLIFNLGDIYFNIPSSSESDSLAISYTLEARQLLVQRRDAGMDDKLVWTMLLKCDSTLYHLYSQMGQFEKAKYHSVQCVATARQCKGPDQVDPLVVALSTLTAASIRESNYLEALSLAEEAYTIASKHFSPAHHTVLKASCQLIDCLLQMKDYSTAETYCRINYSNFSDPLSAGEYDVQDGMDIMNQLVKIWLMKPLDDDEIVAKAQADEAIDLSRKAYASSHQHSNRRFSSNNLCMLCQVLLKANRLTEETEGHLHQLLKICMTENVMDATIRDPLRDLGRFYLFLHDSLPIGQKSISVLQNIELCQRKIKEHEHFNHGSGVYKKGTEKIQPHFKKNVAFCV